MSADGDSKPYPHVHAGGPFLRRGAEPGGATSAMLMVHGRGATAADILTLAEALEKPGMAYVAPQALDRTWYPYSFLAPHSGNEPGLSSGLRRLGEAVEELIDAGVPAERQVLLGFSQGACLALDYAARNPRRYAGVVAFSGGLIGPPGTDWGQLAAGLDGTPVFLGCSDRDPHIPLERVRESEAVLRRLGAKVEVRIYPGMPHTVIEDEVDWVRKLLEEIP